MCWAMDLFLDHDNNPGKDPQENNHIVVFFDVFKPSLEIVTY